MIRQRFVSVITISIALALLAGCRGNPDVRKQKYMESATRFSAEGKYKEATIQYLNALKVDKNLPEAHLGLSKAYEHLGRFDAARIELARTVDLQPENYQARVELGNLLFATGKTTEAQAHADEVLATNPNYPDLHALLSAIAARLGQKDKALSELHHALDLDPNRAAFHEDLALLQDGIPGNAPAVENELKKAVALDPKSANAKLLLASFYSRNNRQQEAERTAWEAVATDPRSLAARVKVAEIILQLGDQPRAEQVLRQASKDLAADPQGVRVLVDYYADSGHVDKAAAELSDLAKKYPNNVSLQKGYARMLLQRNDDETARTVIAGLMKTNSRDPEVAALHGIVSLNEGNTVNTLTALEENAKNFPLDATTQYWLGKAALQTGDAALAEKSFRRAAELNPTDRQTLEEIARIACLQGDMNLMAAVADQAIGVAPRSPSGYIWRATVERIDNSLDSAEADLKIAMSLAPQSPQASLQLGEIRFAQKRFPEGVPLLEQALQYDPGSVSSLQTLIAYDLFRKQPEKAFARLKSQIEKSPTNSRFYDLLAQLQVQSKNLDQAAASTNKAIELSSSDGEAVMLFAQISSLRGQTASAVTTWEQWSSAHPNDANALAILGTLEESRGNLPKAETYNRKALQIQPRQPVAANNLAYRMLLSGGSVDAALTLAQTARLGMPDSPSTADTLAWADYSNGSYEFARALLEDAVSASPNNASMQYHMGMVYSKLSDKSRAVVHLKKATLLEPDSPAGKDAKAALQKLK